MGAEGRFTQNLKECIELTDAQLMRHKSCQVKDFNMECQRDLGTKPEVTENWTSEEAGAA